MRGISEAIKLHQSGKIAQAEAIYDEILARQPEHADALHLKGVALMQRGDARGAVKMISKAIVVKPNDALFFTNLAASLQQVGLPERAIEYAQRALALDPNRYEAHIVTGQCLAAASAYAPALDSFKAAHARQPSDRKSVAGVIDCLQGLGRDAEAEAFIAGLQFELDDPLKMIRGRLLRILNRHDEALAVLQSCRMRAGHDWHAAMLKLRLDRKEPQLSLPHGQSLLEIKQQVAFERMPLPERETMRQDWSAVPPFRANDETGRERNVICFSPWGANPKYTLNAVLNAKHVPHFYPGWSARFYVDDSVPADIVQALVDYGARVIKVAQDARETLKLFWRFLASEDKQVERFLCRDCDAVVNAREAAAVKEWIDSGKRFHVMRDHPEHAELIMAGMWGGIAGSLPDLSDQAVRYYESHEQKWRWVDQDFLRDRVWPVIVEDCLVHDEFYRMGNDCRRFPEGSALPEGEHVGGYRPRFAVEKGAHGAS